MGIQKTKLGFGLMIFLVLTSSSFLAQHWNQEHGSQQVSDKKELEQKVFSRIGRELNPIVYAEFLFLRDQIEVGKPGRLFQDFGIPEGSKLLRGNGFPLTDAEGLGRCMIEYQKTRNLELTWSYSSKVYSKVMSMDDNSFEIVPINFHTNEIEIRDKP